MKKEQWLEDRAKGSLDLHKRIFGSVFFVSLLKNNDGEMITFDGLNIQLEENEFRSPWIK